MGSGKNENDLPPTMALIAQVASATALPPVAPLATPLQVARWIAPATPTANPTSSRRTKVYCQLVHDKNSTQKHAPISPPGTVFLLRDNPGIQQSPMKKGIAEPEKLELKLYCTNGHIHKRFFPLKDEEKWNDPVWIKKANGWRNQNLHRLFKNEPLFVCRGIRAKWGMRETISLKEEVQKKVEAVGNRRLTANEWREITVIHNIRYKGSKVFAGERLLNGEMAKSTQEIDERTHIGVRSLFGRVAELKTFMNNLVDKFEKDGDAVGAGDLDMNDEFNDEHLPEDEMELNEESMDESPTKKKACHGGDIDPRLEEPSDDEDDGQQPASTQTGASLICA